MLEPVAWALAHRNRAVSSPSRPTATNAVSTSAPVPIASAASTLPWSSVFIERAARRIQKTIQVTNPTATIERNPPKASWASKLSELDVNVRIAPKPRLRATAAPMPAQMGPRRSRRSILTRYATRIPTTRAASRPSRSPIRKLLSTVYLANE